MSEGRFTAKVAKSAKKGGGSGGVVRRRAEEAHRSSGYSSYEFTGPAAEFWAGVVQPGLVRVDNAMFVLVLG